MEAGVSLMRIELYGIARARAGREYVDVEATSLREAVLALASACPALVPDVVDGQRLADGFVASLNGGRFLSDGATPLEAGDRLLIVAAEAGG